MTTQTLTNHDLSILSKIQDPESSPSSQLLIETSLPKDPHIINQELYAEITSIEREIIQLFQRAELELKNSSSEATEILSSLRKSAGNKYFDGIARLTSLISSYPKYASARNNRAQALRRCYGDSMLVRLSSSYPADPNVLFDGVPESLDEAASSVLEDLTTAISLLTPPTPFSPISPQAAKTLSQAYTQRGAIYLHTSKMLKIEETELRITGMKGERVSRESNWSILDFEENASRDFMMGGRFGNEIAKGLAVASNPTAKLCGEMVREAMRKEYGGYGVAESR